MNVWVHLLGQFGIEKGHPGKVRIWHAAAWASS